MALILNEAARAIRRTPIVCVMTALTISMAIGVGGLTAFLSYKAHEALDVLKSHIEIEAFFDPEIVTHEAEVAVDQSVKPIQGIASLVFVTKEDALKEYHTSTGEDVLAVLGFNPLPASVRLRLAEMNSDDAKRVVIALKHVAGINEVRYDATGLRRLEERAKGLEQLSWMIGGLLLLSAIAFVHSTTRLAIYARKETIRTMQLLGTRWAIIRAPFVVEGAVAGFFGGVAGAVLFALVGGIILREFAPGLEIQSYNLPHSATILGASILGGVLLGAGVSFLSSLLSIRNSRSNS